MPPFEFHPDDRRCRHLRINGARCADPALQGDTLCFNHRNRKRRTARGRKPTTLPDTFNVVPLVSFAWVEDHSSILFNLNSITEALAHGLIDHRQAMAHTCLQRTALKTLRQMHELEEKISKEKPAQRFELDECGLPVAIDDAAPATADPQSTDPTAPVTPGTSPSAASAPAGQPAPRRPGPSKKKYEDLVRDYYNNNPEFLLPMGIQPRPEPDPANAPEPASDATPEPTPDPAPEPTPDPATERRSLVPPYPEPARHQTQEAWEDTVRDYYNNDPVLLAIHGLLPRPEPQPQVQPQTQPDESLAPATPLPAAPALVPELCAAEQPPQTRNPFVSHTCAISNHNPFTFHTCANGRNFFSRRPTALNQGCRSRLPMPSLLA